MPGLIRIFPNPSTGVFTVQLPESRAGVRVVVYDMAGRALTSKWIGVGGNSFDLDISLLTDGVYVVKMEGVGISAMHKVTIVR